MVLTSDLFEQCIAGIFARGLVGANDEHRHTLCSLYD